MAGMAWDWAGPAATAGGALVGAWVVIWGRSVERKLARDRFTHERQLGHAQRYGERRADAYVEAMEVAEKVGRFIYSLGRPGPLVDPPDIEVQIRSRVRVLGYGSPSVKLAYERWYDVSMEAWRAYVLFATEPAVARERIKEIQPHEKAARVAMREAIAADLATA